MPLRFLGAHDDLGHPVGNQFVGQFGDTESGLGVLGAGHRDGGVVEDLVGDVDPGGDTRLDGQLAGVEIRSVTDVLEDVLDVGEGCLTDPLRAFAAHLGQPGDL